MALDTAILAIFGSPPGGIDLTEKTNIIYDTISCVFFAIAVVAVALRFHVRLNLSGGLSWDDYTMIFGLVCTISTLVTQLLASKLGSGKHVWAMSISNLTPLLKLVYIEPWVYATAVTSTKVSILLLYRRLFSSNAHPDRSYKVMSWAATILTTVYPIIMWIVMGLACRPISFYWEQYTVAGVKGTCINVTLFYLVFGIVNMLNDIVILLVPVPIIIKLHMSTRKKVSIAGIMLLGSFVCVASAIRIYYLHKLAYDIDVTWWFGPGFGWSSIEPSVAVISACLPTLAPLFKHFRAERSTKSNSGTSGHKMSSLMTIGSARRFKGRPRGLADPAQTDTWIEVDDKDIMELARNDVDSSKGSSERGILVSRQIHVSSS